MPELRALLCGGCSHADGVPPPRPPPRFSVAKSLQPGPEAPSLVPEARSPGRAPRVVSPAATFVTLPRSRCLCRLPGASGDRRHLRPLRGPDGGGEGVSRAELPPGPLTPAPLGASSRGPPAPLGASGLLGPSPGSDTVPAAHEVLLPVIPSQGRVSFLVKPVAWGHSGLLSSGHTALKSFCWTRTGLSGSQVNRETLLDHFQNHSFALGFQLHNHKGLDALGI